MDAPGASADSSELTALRRRAYGPGADIHSDTAALVRLRDLEERERASRAGDRADADALAVSPGGESPPTRAEITTGADSAPKRRVPRWMLAVSIAVVGVGVGLAVGMAIPQVRAADPVATLSPVDDEGIEQDFLDSDGLAFFDLDQDSLVPYETFGEYRAWSGVNGSGAPCLFIAVDGQWMDGGCTPIGLAPTAQVVTYDESAGTSPTKTVVRYAQRSDGLIDVWVTTGAEPDS